MVVVSWEQDTKLPAIDEDSACFGVTWVVKREMRWQLRILIKNIRFTRDPRIKDAEEIMEGVRDPLNQAQPIVTATIQLTIFSQVW